MFKSDLIFDSIKVGIIYAQFNLDAIKNPVFDYRKV